MVHQKHPISQPSHSAPEPKAAANPYVKVTFVFRDVLQQPIEGLSVQFNTATDAEPQPQWIAGPDTDPDPNTESLLSPPMVANSMVATTDKNGYAVTIQNAIRTQPIGVYVKNRRGEYVWKATVTPKKDISTFTVISPEYHLEATTKLTPKEAFEQDLNLPVVEKGEVMTIERLVKEFGPYIGWSQKVTEQGRVKKDVPTRHEEISIDEKTKMKKKIVKIEHHFKVVDNGKPRTVVLNVLGSRLNYPSPSLFSEEQYKTMATQLDVEVAAIKAIVMQECSGIPFENNGLPKIRYERHRFYALLQLRHQLQEAAAIKLAHQKGEKKKVTPFKNPYPQFPDLCFPTPGGYGSDGLHQYEKLTQAAELDFDVAIQSCSWGGFQILADVYASCGCATSFEFANKFISGSDGQMMIFVLFMKNVKPAGVKALRARNWEGVASAYNGSYWKKSNPDYASNLHKFYNEFK
jgi:hypothetical protein